MSPRRVILASVVFATMVVSPLASAETAVVQDEVSNLTSGEDSPFRADADDDSRGARILKCLHFTGKFDTASFDSEVVRDGVGETYGTIWWKGGILGTKYQTKVVIQKKKSSGEWRIRVSSDTAMIQYDINCKLLGWADH